MLTHFRLSMLVFCLLGPPAFAQGDGRAQPVAAITPAPATQSASDQRRFDVEEYQVEGNTLLPTEEIEAAVYPYLGPDRTLADIEAARVALEKLYADRGYRTVSAELPEQHAGSGVIVLRVVERRIGRLRVTGARYFSPDQIRQSAPSLAEGSVPNLNDVRRDVLNLNQWPDRTVTPALKAGRLPDTVDVDLQVDDHLPLHGTVGLDNRRSVDTTALRTDASLTYDNLFQRGDSVTGFFQVAPQKTTDALAYSASYLFRIPGTNLSILGSYFRSNSNVTAVGSTDVVGKGQIAGGRLIIPLGVDGGFTHTLSAGIDFKRFFQVIAANGQTNNTPVTYWPLTAAYQASLAEQGALTSLGLTVVAGNRVLSGDKVINLPDPQPTDPNATAPTTAFDNQRVGARTGFFAAKASVERTQDLPYGAVGYVHAVGQVSPNPLIQNEQVSIGGVDTVRGYLESEILGDSGGAAQFELRSPNLAAYAGAPEQDLRLHLFVDRGGATINSPYLPDQTKSFGASSVGGGVRVKLFDHLNGTVEDALALSTAPNTHAGSDRVLFRVFGDF